MTFLEVAQLVSIILAAGTPGMTYYVMMRVARDQIKHIEQNCVKCRREIDNRIEAIDCELDGVQTRQHELREKDLPEKFARHRDVEAVKTLHEKDVEIIHKRIDRYHPA